MQTLGNCDIILGGCVYTTNIMTGVSAHTAPLYAILPGVSGGSPMGKDTWRGGGAGSVAAAQSAQVRGLLRLLDQPQLIATTLGQPQFIATTLMVHNLPRRVTLKNFVAELDNCGFAGLYDWLFIPTYKSSGNPKGYGFINFNSSVMAKCFMDEWRGCQRFGLKGRSKIMVSIADLQGFGANVAGFDEVEGMSEEHNMLILRKSTENAAAASSGTAASAFSSGAASANGASLPTNVEQSSSSSSTPGPMQEDEMAPTAPPELTVPMPSFV